MNQDIYVRAHSVQLETKKPQRSGCSESKWPDYVLAFDCETRLTADQSLTFGVWRFCELQNGIYVATQEGIAHAHEDLSAEEFNSLRKYATALRSS